MTDSIHPLNDARRPLARRRAGVEEGRNARSGKSGRQGDANPRSARNLARDGWSERRSSAILNLSKQDRSFTSVSDLAVESVIEAVTKVGGHETMKDFEIAFPEAPYRSISKRLRTFVQAGLVVKTERKIYSLPNAGAPPVQMASRTGRVLRLLTSHPKREWRLSELYAAFPDQKPVDVNRAALTLTQLGRAQRVALGVYMATKGSSRPHTSALATLALEILERGGPISEADICLSLHPASKDNISKALRALAARGTIVLAKRGVYHLAASHKTRAKYRRAGSLRDKVSALFQDGKPRRKVDVARMLDEGRGVINRAVDRLHESRILHDLGAGYYGIDVTRKLPNHRMIRGGTRN